MYTHINFKSKKAVKESIAAGKKITVFQPGPWGTDKDTSDGTVALEGPHYPEPHRWYGTGTIKDGYLVKIS